MQKSQMIKAFSTLSCNLESFIKKENFKSENDEMSEFHETLLKSKAKNGWFTIENQCYALSAWAKALTKENLEKWLSNYNINEKDEKLNIGIITAGNIPLVGFHDILTVMISGNRAIIKLSGNDDILIPFILNQLIEIEPEFKNYFEIVNQLKNYDAIIATGSDNTARYFETYFKNVPHIIRKNRTSIAVLDGNESDQDLENLSYDILMHFGLGCRNVTKIFVPKGYDLDLIFKKLFTWSDIINHHKYANNYDYHKAIYLMKGLEFTENGFVLIKKDDGLFSPISTIFYQEYDEMKEVSNFIAQNRDKIQCIVGNSNDYIPFGKTQKPELWDYADDVDTMEWLLSINK